MEDPLQFEPLNVREMSHEEIAGALREMAEEFPSSGCNYDEQILVEALRRKKLFRIFTEGE